MQAAAKVRATLGTCQPAALFLSLSSVESFCPTLYVLFAARVLYLQGEAVERNTGKGAQLNLYITHFTCVFKLLCLTRYGPNRPAAVIGEGDFWYGLFWQPQRLL